MTSAALLIKAAMMALSSERVRKGIGWTIAAILSPVIVVLALILGMFSGTANHNTSALELSFYGGNLSASVPQEYHDHIRQMQSSFKHIDERVSELSSQVEVLETLNTIRMKAIFYALYFGIDHSVDYNFDVFIECFIEREECIREVINDDGESVQETYIVIIPIKDVSEIYRNIAQKMSIQLSEEQMANATEIYYRITYGGPSPAYGNGFDDFINSIPLSSEPFVGEEGFYSPTGVGWQQAVSSEFGYRFDPFTGQRTYHGGIDIALPKGTPVNAMIDGTVILVRYLTSGYGYYVVVDHGGGFISLYAHCSSILVNEGQRVSAGEVIAKVGSTGRSTGNHLHFEVRIDGVKQNPRNYLP